jgi:hypothetical protein
MKERVKVRFDGKVVDATLIEKPASHDDDGRRFYHWAFIADTTIEFEENSIPKVEIQRRGAWIECSDVRIPEKGRSDKIHVAFPALE